MAESELIVERVWTSSKELDVSFLERFCIYVQIRNKSGRILRIEKIECHFQIEEGVKPYVPSKSCGENLSDGHLSSPISVWFDADLAFKAYTNQYRIVISYNDGKKKTLEHDPQKFLVFNPLGPGEPKFFISHKDPEDTERARRLAGFLKKLGFAAYVSEDDHRPGMDLWGKKIPEAISDSIGIIILWTARAAKSPANIYREIALAKSKKKRLILSKEKKLRPPRAFPKKKTEYYPFNRPFDFTQIKELAYHIHETYRRGGYS
jgi:hypothetical protein